MFELKGEYTPPMDSLKDKNRILVVFLQSLPSLVLLLTGLCLGVTGSVRTDWFHARCEDRVLEVGLVNVCIHKAHLLEQCKTYLSVTSQLPDMLLSAVVLVMLGLFGCFLTIILMIMFTLASSKPNPGLKNIPVALVLACVSTASMVFMGLLNLNNMLSGGDISLGLENLANSVDLQVSNCQEEISTDTLPWKLTFTSAWCIVTAGLVYCFFVLLEKVNEPDEKTSNTKIITKIGWMKIANATHEQDIDISACDLVTAFPRRVSLLDTKNPMKPIILS